MIIITGSSTGRAETIGELTALCLEHVGRSRLEPGCISHAVYVDTENPLRLFFFEEWADRAAVAVHFAVLESGAFVRAAGKLSVGAPEIRIYEAEVRTAG